MRQLPHEGKGGGRESLGTVLLENRSMVNEKGRAFQKGESRLGGGGGKELSVKKIQQTGDSKSEKRSQGIAKGKMTMRG